MLLKWKCKEDKFQTICPYEVESRDPEWMEYSGGDLKNPRFHLLFLEKSVHWELRMDRFPEFSCLASLFAQLEHDDRFEESNCSSLWSVHIPVVIFQRSLWSFQKKIFRLTHKLLYFRSPLQGIGMHAFQCTICQNVLQWCNVFL